MHQLAQYLESYPVVPNKNSMKNLQWSERRIIMPRPTQGRTSGTATKRSNPFSNWRARREAKQLQAQEAAAKVITDDTANNEQLIVDTLRGIDFLHSTVDTKKSDENQRCGDLEYAARAMVQHILKNPQTIQADMRPIDTKLLALVGAFKEAVECGYPRAANAAKVALVRGIFEIRRKVPQTDIHLYERYVRVNAEYLESWYTLVSMCREADATKENVDTEEQVLAKREEEKEQMKANLLKDISDNGPRAEAFQNAVHHDTPEERAKWTKEERDVFTELVDQRMMDVRLGFNRALLVQKKMALSTLNSQIGTLKDYLANMKIVSDPNLLNKFKDEVENAFHYLADLDAKFAETATVMEEIEGRISQLDNAPGAIRGKEIATEQAQRALDEIKSEQEKKLKQSKNPIAHNLGINTAEEQLALEREAKLEAERLQAEIEAEMETYAAENEIEATDEELVIED